MNSKYIAITLLTFLILSCGAVATITPAKYKVTVGGTGTFTDVIHYAWIDDATVLILTRTEGQVDIIATTPSEVTVERIQ